jgi:hypothetical protein
MDDVKTKYIDIVCTLALDLVKVLVVFFFKSSHMSFELLTNVFSR